MGRWMEKVAAQARVAEVPDQEVVRCDPPTTPRHKSDKSDERPGAGAQEMLPPDTAGDYAALAGSPLCCPPASSPCTG